jgi:hypothetical protein
MVANATISIYMVIVKLYKLGKSYNTGRKIDISEVVTWLADNQALNRASFKAIEKSIIIEFDCDDLAVQFKLSFSEFLSEAEDL